MVTGKAYKKVFKEQLIHFPSKPTVADPSGRCQQLPNCVRAALVSIQNGLKNEFAFFVSVPRRTGMAKCRCSVSVDTILGLTPPKNLSVEKKLIRRIHFHYFHDKRSFHSPGATSNGSPKLAGFGLLEDCVGNTKFTRFSKFSNYIDSIVGPDNYCAVRA